MGRLRRLNRLSASCFKRWKSKPRKSKPRKSKPRRHARESPSDRFNSPNPSGIARRKRFAEADQRSRTQEAENIGRAGSRTRSQVFGFYKLAPRRERDRRIP